MRVVRVFLPLLLLALPASAHAMPAVAVAVAASAAGSAVAGAFFAAGTLGFGLVSGGVGLLVSAAGNALFGQSAPAADPAGSGSFQSEARGRTQVVRSAVEPRKRVYGEIMVSGPLVYAETTGGSNEYLHLVIPVAAHQIASIDAVYLNDEPVGAWDGAGNVTSGRYYVERTVAAVSRDTVGAGLTGTLGAVPSAIQSLVILLPDAGTSVAMTEVSGSPSSALEYSRSGATITFHADAQNCPWTANYTYLTGTSHVRVKTHLGATDQAADADLVAESGGKWTASHQLRGVAYVYLRLLWNADLFPGGVPNVKCLVRGCNTIEDPRVPSTGYSQNWALVVRDYLMASAADGGMEASADEIDDTAFMAAANVCDESVSLASGSQVRYTCDGTVDTSRSPLEILKSLMTGAAGVLTYSNSAFGVYPAAWTTPTVTLTTDDLRGALRVTTRMARRELFNAVRGTYASPDNFWQPADFPAVVNSTYATQDGGDVIYRDIELPFTTDATRAQRLAKIALEKARQGITVTAPCKLTVLPLAMWDTVQLTDSALGWSAKTFRVAGWKLAADGLGVDLVLREDTSASYDWAYGEATTVDAAPDTNLPRVNVRPGSLTGLSVDSGQDQLLRTGDGTIQSRALFSWTPTTDRFVASGGRIDVEVKQATDDAFVPWASLPGDAASVMVAPVLDGAVYLFRVRQVNTLGVAGEWATVEATIVGKTEPPGDVASFSIEGTTLAWSTVNDVDVAGYRIRFQPGTTRSWGDAVAMHEGLVTDSPWDMQVVPSGQVTLMIKAVDTTGNESANAAIIVTDLGDPVVANVVETFDRQAASWPGTLTQGTESGANLVADSSTLMWNENDAAAMWSADDSALMWSAAAYKQMTYEDRVTVSAALSGSRMTIDATVTGVPWSLEYRENSAALMWSASSADLMWSTDDTTLMWDAPAWQAWPGSIVVHDSMYDFRIITGQGTTQGVVSGFTVTVDAPDIVESFADVSIAAAGTRLALTKPFSVIKYVNCTLQTDGGTGVTVTIEDKDAALGPLLKVRNASLTAVDGTIDAIAGGY